MSLLRLAVVGLVTCSGTLAGFGCRAQPRLTGQPVPIEHLHADWRLVEMNGQSVPPVAGITLRLDPDGQVSGSAGVNRYFGAYESPAAGSLRFHQLGSTRMAGEPEAMRRETEFLNTMQRIRAYTMDANVLHLSDGWAEVLLFQREPPRRR